MAATLSRVTEYSVEPGQIHGHDVNIVTYSIGPRYACRIENREVGLTVCTVFGETKEEALLSGISKGQTLFHVMPASQGRANRVRERSISKIVLQADGSQVFFLPEEFLSLSMADRMNHILGGQLTFFDETEALITAGEAIELLRKSPGSSPVLA